MKSRYVSLRKNPAGSPENKNQSAEGAGGLGIIMGNKVRESE